MYENPRCQWWFPNNIIHSWISTTCTIAVIYTGRPQVQLVFEYTTDSICRVYNRIDRDLSINKRYVTVEITWSRGVLERRGGEINEKTDDQVVDWSMSKICHVGKGGWATSVAEPKAITTLYYLPPQPVHQYSPTR